MIFFLKILFCGECREQNIRDYIFLSPISQKPRNPLKPWPLGPCQTWARPRCPTITQHSLIIYPQTKRNRDFISFSSSFLSDGCESTVFCTSCSVRYSTTIFSCLKGSQDSTVQPFPCGPLILLLLSPPLPSPSLYGRFQGPHKFRLFRPHHTSLLRQCAASHGKCLHHNCS